MYTWKGLVEPMWKVIRFNVLMADLTLVPSKTMKARPVAAAPARRSPAFAARTRLVGVVGVAPASWGRSGPALRSCPAGVAGIMTRRPWSRAAHAAAAQAQPAQTWRWSQRRVRPTPAPPTLDLHDPLKTPEHPRRAGGAGAQPVPEPAHRRVAAGGGHRRVQPALPQRRDARAHVRRPPRRRHPHLRRPPGRGCARRPSARARARVRRGRRAPPGCPVGMAWRGEGHWRARACGATGLST